MCLWTQQPFLCLETQLLLTPVAPQLVELSNSRQFIVWWHICCVPEPSTFLTPFFFWQVAVAQYSEEPRAAFHFNQHRDRNSVLRAVRGLGYTGGNTKTGVYGWGAHVGWIFWTKTEDVDQGQHLSECFKPIYKARKLWPKVLQNCKWGT